MIAQFAAIALLGSLAISAAVLIGAIVGARKEARAGIRATSVVPPQFTVVHAVRMPRRCEVRRRGHAPSRARATHRAS